jgi:hypothetical protein
MSTLHRASRWLVTGFVVALAGCGGGGGGGGGSPAPALAASKIFVADSGHAAIGSSPNSNPSPGAAVVDRVISGGGTLLDNGLKDFAIDAANDRLFVSDGVRILAFDNVSTANGSVAPRIVTTAAGGDTFAGIYLDTAHNQLYATVRLALPGNEIRVYTSAAAASNAAPARTFSFTCDFVFDIAVDTTLDVAYVYYVTSSVAHIAVFNGASGLNNSVALTQTIDFSSGPLSTASIGIFVDTANNRLYVPNVPSSATVEVFNNANTASGPAVPSRTINLAGVTSYSNVFVELSADRLYAADPTSVTIAANASTTTSTVGGVRILAPSGGTFTAVAVKP